MLVQRKDSFHKSRLRRWRHLRTRELRVLPWSFRRRCPRGLPQANLLASRLKVMSSDTETAWASRCSSRGQVNGHAMNAKSAGVTTNS
eukprot:g8997.t1